MKMSKTGALLLFVGLVSVMDIFWACY